MSLDLLLEVPSGNPAEMGSTILKADTFAEEESNSLREVRLSAKEGI